MTLTAAPDLRSSFSGWSGTCLEIGTVNDNSITFSIVLASTVVTSFPLRCTAEFGPSPVITLVNPNSGQQGQTLNVAITGQFTDFAAGTSAVGFEAGITVGTVTVTDATHLTAQISIAAAAAVGSHTVTVTTGAEVVSLANGFSVTAGAPVITLVNPNSGQQGQTLNVAITGQFTDFAAGTSAANFGAGITVGTVTVTDATHLTAQLSIDAAAALGSRTVSVTSGTQAVSLANGFTVALGGNLAVRLNPFGTRNLSEGPFNIEVVNSELTAVPATQDVTVTLSRDVVSPCRGVIFSSTRTFVIPQGQSTSGGPDAAGRDPSCNTSPTVTEWRVLGATMGGTPLSVVPSASFLAIRR